MKKLYLFIILLLAIPAVAMADTITYNNASCTGSMTMTLIPGPGRQISWWGNFSDSGYISGSYIDDVCIQIYTGKEATWLALNHTARYKVYVNALFSNLSYADVTFSDYSSDASCPTYGNYKPCCMKDEGFVEVKLPVVRIR